MYELGHQKNENEHIYDLCDLPVEHKRKDEPTKVGRNNILVIERMKICLAAVLVSFVLFCIALSVLIVVIKTGNEAKIKQQMTARFNTMENLINKSFVEKEAKIKQQMTARFNTMGNLINKSFVEKARSKECADIDFIQDGIFLVYPNGENNPKHVYCIMQDNKKWTVIQRRFDFSVNFTKTWNEYKEGFGVASGEHWLGNEYIHVISTNGRHRARFILEKNGIEKYAEYSNFRVEDEKSKYMLNVSGYSGTAGDALLSAPLHHRANGQKFSTFDQDNDVSAIHHCAKQKKGGWWYTGCSYASLNNMISNEIDWYYYMDINLDESTILITKD